MGVSNLDTPSTHPAASSDTCSRLESVKQTANGFKPYDSLTTTRLASGKTHLSELSRQYEHVGRSFEQKVRRSRHRKQLEAGDEGLFWDTSAIMGTYATFLADDCLGEERSLDVDAAIVGRWLVSGHSGATGR